MVSLADIQRNRDYEPSGGADEDLSYLSMESLFTPPGVGMDERRMQVRAYNHWLAMVENGELPAVEELHPEDIPDFGPNGVLIDLTLGIDWPAIVFLGERLAAECGDEREIFGLGDVPERSLLSRLTEHCLEVVATHSPVGYEAEFEGQTRTTVHYRSILLPFSSNGETVHFVFGVISWREGADRVAAPPPIPATQPIVQTKARAKPGLATLLEQARTAARQAFASEARSRGALYRAISVTYDLALAAESDSAGFAELAIGARANGGLRAVAELVFGSHHDKTRMSEIVTLLTHARRQDLPQGALHAWLEGQPGGIKALLTEARHPARKRTNGRRTSPALARRIRHAAPLALDAAIAEPHEFGLLVARRNPDGTLALIGDAGSDVRLFERAARRLLAR